MSLVAKAAYMAAKANLVYQKVDGFIDKLDKIAMAGVQLLNDLVAKLNDMISKLNELAIKALTYLTTQEKKLQAYLLRQKAKLEAKIAKLIDRLTAYKTQACAKLSDIIDQSVKGISGVTINSSITPPDPLTGAGGSISIIPVPDPIDESTILIDSTITAPTTVVTSTVTGSTAVSNLITVA